MNLSRSLSVCAALVLTLSLAAPSVAEQMRRIGDFEAHYSLLPTTFLKPDIAARYGITRGRDQALLNVSILGADGVPVPAQLSGSVRDLLGQQRTLEFQEVQEGQAVYYLTTMRHDHREVLRLAIDIGTPDGAVHRLEFQQELFWADR
jgi:hypothetical protein